MRKNKSSLKLSIPQNLYLIGTTFLIGFIIFLSGCEKDTTSEDELIGNWKRGYEFEGVGRTEAVAFIIDDKVYIGGGYDGSDRLQDFWSFDQTTGTWTQIAQFPGIARNSAVAFAVNGKGYIGTGYDEDDNKLKDFWEYNPATNVWTRKADFGGTGRYGAVAFAINNKGYVGTGYDGSYLKDLWEYDPSANVWTQKASLAGSKRTDAAVFVYNNRAYVVSGFNNGSYLNDFWAYNPTTNAWSEKRKITDVSDDSYDDDYDNNITRSNAMIFVMNTKAYLTCGNYSGIIGTAWEYDIENDTWKKKTGFEGSAREGGIGFSVNNKGYIVTGNNSSYRFDDLWEFFPDEEQSDSDN
jgi:N-acetylneuraminic acid mutarotase